jgi:hypothetical protein
MSESNQPLSEQYRLVAKAWVEADGAARMLEELKTTTLAQWVKTHGDVPVNAAERDVKSSKEWEDYLGKMVEARTKANLKKVQLEFIRMRAAEHQSAEASKRAEMRL